MRVKICVVFVSTESEIGKPLSSEMIDEIVQSPRSIAADAALSPTACPRRTATRTIGEIDDLVRNVEDPDRVLGVDVVGVLRAAGRVALEKKLLLAELVVLQPAVGVVDAPAPPRRHALLELEDRRVILALAERRSGASGCHRTAGTAAATGGAAPSDCHVEALPCRQPEERVRHVVEQRRAERRCRGSSWLMLMTPSLRAAQPEVAAGGAGVLEADRHVAGAARG